MKFTKVITATIIVLSFFTSCIKEVKIATREEKPLLVVEGSITTDTMPYTVRLTYSGPYKYALDVPEQYLEKSADVSIMDDLGNETKLTYTGDGIYQTSNANYIGTVGRSYSIIVLLKDGKKYISNPEKINPPVPLQDYKAQFFNDFNGALPTYLQVSIDSKDPVDQENYYRWTFYSWILKQTRGVSCGANCIEFEYCYQKTTDREVRILSDASINGNEITDKIIGKSYIYTFGNHFIDIGQLSLTREAYQFWQRYDDQVSRSGSTLDPLPAPVKGNIYNASDPTDFALGYFSASSVTHKRAVLIPYGITQYLLDISAINFIPPQSIACFDYYPNSLSYPEAPAKQYPPPPGWEHADTLKVYW
jgi:hypothetical protein